MLALWVSNTMKAAFCLRALDEALARFGSPEVFDTDQGSHFISADLTDVLEAAWTRVARHGRGGTMLSLSSCGIA